MRRTCAQRISKVFDQYLAFIALESGMFSLGLPNTYLQLNDPAARDTQIEVLLALENTHSLKPTVASWSPLASLASYGATHAPRLLLL